VRRSDSLKNTLHVSLVSVGGPVLEPVFVGEHLGLQQILSAVLALRIRFHMFARLTPSVPDHEIDTFVFIYLLYSGVMI
jgi:hypothetical protein